MGVGVCRFFKRVARSRIRRSRSRYAWPAKPIGRATYRMSHRRAVHGREHGPRRENRGGDKRDHVPPVAQGLPLAPESRKPASFSDGPVRCHSTIVAPAARRVRVPRQ